MNDYQKAKDYQKGENNARVNHNTNEDQPQNYQCCKLGFFALIEAYTCVQICPFPHLIDGDPMDSL